MNERHGERPDSPADKPAPHITSKARTAEWVNGNRPNAARRGGGHPAPTLHFGAAMNDVKWEMRSGQSVNGNGRAERSSDAPALTVIARTDLCEWVGERPSTAVCGDPRGSPPGYRGNPEDYADGNPTRSGDNAVRVTEAEALILQGFSPDHPVQGSRSKRFEQIGNAIPPPLAKAILGQLTQAHHPPPER